VTCAKTAAPIEMLFGSFTWLGTGHKEACIRWGAHWRHLAYTIEPSMRGGVEACCQIALTTCCNLLSMQIQLTHKVAKSLFTSLHNFFVSGVCVQLRKSFCSIVISITKYKVGLAQLYS